MSVVGSMIWVRGRLRFSLFLPHWKTMQLILIDDRGDAVTVTALPGSTVMHAAKSHGVAGIEGQCGGSCACATCHVMVDEAFADRLPPPSAGEILMLGNVASPRQPSSRLACQIILTQALDGLIVRMPEYQS